MLLFKRLSLSLFAWLAVNSNAHASVDSEVEPLIRGLPIPTAQFNSVTHQGLRYLYDLAPGYVLAQRIEDKKEVILETINKNVPRIFEVDSNTVARNTHNTIGWRRWWIAESNSVLTDPRESLLYETLDGVRRGVRNANGRQILDCNFASIELSPSLKFVATTCDENSGEPLELSTFTAAGEPIYSSKNLAAVTLLPQKDFLLVYRIPKKDNLASVIDFDGKQVHPMTIDLFKSEYVSILNELEKNNRVSDNEFGAKKTGNLLTVNVASITRIAEADHSLDTEHFVPSVWKEALKPNGYRGDMLVGFCQDHEFMGMEKEELVRYLGYEMLYESPTEQALRYALNQPECGNARIRFEFKVVNNRITGWRRVNGLEPTPWRTDSPLVNGQLK